MPVLRRNSLVILPAGTDFRPEGLLRLLPALATNTLARVPRTVGVQAVEHGLARLPGAFRVILAEGTFDEAGQRYAAGTAVELPARTVVQPAYIASHEPLRVLPGASWR